MENLSATFRLRIAFFNSRDNDMRRANSEDMMTTFMINVSIFETGSMLYLAFICNFALIASFNKWINNVNKYFE